MPGFQRRSSGALDTANEEVVIGAVAYAMGDLLMASRSAATLVAATASSTVTLMHGGGIVQNATDGVVTKAVIQPINYNAIYEVESANNSDTDHNYMRMKLTDLNTVNNAGSDEGTNCVVYQVGTVGATGDNKILVKFLPALT